MPWVRLRPRSSRRAPPWRAARRAGPGAPLPLLLLGALLAAQAPVPAAALYHTASETLHWFSHRAQFHPGRLK